MDQELTMQKSESDGSQLWRWIPTLYFSQGIPYVVVMSLSVILYKNMGISNVDIALYTSWLYLPFVIKPLWSPFVDMFKTKRAWIIGMELIIGSLFALVALTIPADGFFGLTLLVFWLLAFSCTGFMALGMMLPGMFSGWLQAQLGYAHFFIWICISAVPTFIVTALIRVDPAFGKKV
jgi:MFS family permease